MSSASDIRTDPVLPPCGCDPGDPDGRGIRRQFGHPTGVVGWLIGHLMAIKNAERSRWVLAQLDIRPGDRVLEVGFGSGVDLRRAATLARGGFVAGVDPSAVMLRQARRRNRTAIGAGRVDLRLGSVTALPFGSASFDRAFSINAVQFWRDSARGLAEFHRVLRPAGRLAVAIQPRSKGATDETTREWGERLQALCRQAGFTKVRLETQPLRPVPVACALAVR